jgi:hypothetical protein
MVPRIGRYSVNVGASDAAGFLDLLLYAAMA